MFPFFCLIFLIVNPVTYSQEWEVNYLNKIKCALKGSTTVLSGSFTYPKHLNIMETFWTVDPSRDKETLDVSKDPQYKNRVDHILNKNHTFIFKLSNVTRADKKMYCIRIVTDVEKEKYLGYPGIDLQVTELQVEGPEVVLEGNPAVLSCKSTCNFASNPQYIWYKNKIPLSESFSRQKLFVQSVRRDDAGEYSCAVTKHEDLTSPAVTLNVTYAPKKVSASISSSGVIVEGDSVTLTCSSESNPSANISWFKENQTSSVGSGQSFITQHDGNFYCVAQNQHGSQRSAVVSVIFSGRQRKVLLVTAGIVTALVCICVVIVIISIVRRKAVDSGVTDRSKQENKSVKATDQIPVHPPASHPKPANLNDFYASIAHHRPSEPSTDQSAGDDEDVQYACVHHYKNTKNNKEEAESQCGNVSNHGPAISSGSYAGLVEDSSVIYSSIKVT